MLKTATQIALSRLSLTQICLIALTARLLCLLLLPNPLFPDADTYRIAGAALFHGSYFSDKVMPLYPILTYLSGGEWGLKLLDIALSTGTVVLVYRISYVLFEDSVVSNIAALCTAIYPYFIFYSISGLTETCFIFLLCLSFYYFYTRQYIIGSIISVLGILTRPLNDLLMPLLILTFILIVHRQSWKTALKYTGLYLLIYAVMMSPWWIFNYERYHHFVRTNLGVGIVVYSGNNPMNRSGGGIGDIDVDASRFFSLYKNPIKRNQALISAGIQYAMTHPWHIIKLDGIKFLRFWRLYPYTPKYKNAFTIIVSLLSYGIMLVLFLTYLINHLKQDWRKICPILLFTLYLMFGCMLTIASLRYRLPVEPFIIIFGSYTLYEWLRERPSTHKTSS